MPKNILSNNQDFDKPRKLKWLAQYNKHRNIGDACLHVKVSRNCYTKHYKNDPWFRGLKTEVDERSIDFTENALCRRADGYEFDEIHEEQKVDSTGKLKVVKKTRIRKHIAPDVTAQIFRLCNLRPERYRNIQRVEHGGKLETEETLNVKGIDADALKELARAIVKAKADASGT